MTNMPSTLLRVAASLMLAVLAVATVDGRVVRRPFADETCTPLGAFEQRLEAYAVLHRDLAASLPPLGSHPDRHLAAVARAYLASAIKVARATARQGDIFTPEATRFFRMVFAETTSARFGTFAPLMDEDGRVLSGIHPDIHTPFPVGATQEVPASTLFMLPTLPPELEYRIVDYDLVLWDVDADLIVDVLPYVVADPASDLMYR
jgi:hypothetical protein